MVSPVVGWRPKTRLTLCPQNPKEFDIRPDHAGADDEMPGDSFRRAHDRPFLADSAAVSISGGVVTSNMCPSLRTQAGPGAGLVTAAPEWGRPEYTDDTRRRDFYILIDLLQVKIILIVLLQSSS